MKRTLLTVCALLASSASACTGDISSIGRDFAGGSGGLGGTTADGGLASTGGARSGGVPGSGGSIAGSGGATPASGGVGASNGTGGRADGTVDGGPLGAVCPGTAPPPSGYPTCRIATECPQGSTGCDFTPSQSCGACVPPPDSECQTDAACGAGRICEAYSLQVSCLCAAPPSPLKRCIASCVTTGCPNGAACGSSGRCAVQSCASGYRCPEAYACAPTRAGADAHGCAPADCNVDAYRCPDGFRCEPGQKCVPMACDRGFGCSPNFDCTPGSTAPHGCVRRACTTDADCDCGACINALCQDRLFVCSRGAP